jgi:UPF0755 protein
MNIRKKLLLGISVAILILLIGAFFYGCNKIYYSHGIAQEAKTIKIIKGDNAMSVGNKLENENLISGKYYFAFYIWKNNLKNKLVAGEYSIEPKLNIPEISRIITHGEVDSTRTKVTFPEGWESKYMEARIKEYGLNTDGFKDLVKNPEYFREKYGYDFLADIPQGKTLEGYLFPDTYFFLKNATAEDIIKKMLDNFSEKLTADLKTEIKNQNKSVYDIIAMASIIEGEVKSEEDRAIVSGIFWKRVNEDRPLQSCATLAFILGENKKQYSFEDTRIDSPYNTYLNKGLPPGPINNPGLASIKAAIYPKTTNYNYFLTDPQTGQTIFSKTIDEHNANKAKYGL